MSSGTDWTDRMKGLAARAPDLDIFSQSFVVRDAEGWEITDAGRAFLVSLEAPTSVTSDAQKAIADITQSDRSEVVAVTTPSPPPPLLLIGRNRRRPRPGRFVDRTRRSVKTWRGRGNCWNRFLPRSVRHCPAFELEQALLHA
jgi:hypothetical protein